MSIEQKRRAAFEAWAAVNGISIVRTSQALAFANGQSRAVGDYIMIESLCSWAAWNAALDSVVIELPNIETDHPIEIEAQADMRSRCREAIESAFLKVKS